MTHKEMKMTFLEYLKYHPTTYTWYITNN
jgi:hypothetical protein